jgi:hypothetical protein
VFGFGKDGWDWKRELDSPGAQSMTHLAKLMNSFRPNVRLTRVPDQSLLAGDAGTAERFQSNRVTAMRTQSGSLAAFYTAAGRPFRVHMKKLAAGPMTVYWFYPRTGKWVTPEGERIERKSMPGGVPSGPGAAVHEFTPPGPAGEGQDWVLVITKNPSLS